MSNWKAIHHDDDHPQQPPFDGQRYLIRTEPGVTGQDVWVAYWDENMCEWMTSAPGFVPHAISECLEWLEIPGGLPKWEILHDAESEFD